MPHPRDLQIEILLVGPNMAMIVKNLLTGKHDGRRLSFGLVTATHPSH